MGDEIYLKAAVHAALENGQTRMEAQRILLSQALRDPALLIALTKPHLKAIVSHALDRFAGKAVSGSTSSSTTEGRISATKFAQAKPAAEPTIEKSVMSALASQLAENLGVPEGKPAKAVPYDFKKPSAPPSLANKEAVKGSPRHQTAMAQIISAFEKKK